MSKADKEPLPQILLKRYTFVETPMIADSLKQYCQDRSLSSQHVYGQSPTLEDLLPYFKRNSNLFDDVRPEHMRKGDLDHIAKMQMHLDDIVSDREGLSLYLEDNIRQKDTAPDKTSNL